MKSLREIYEEDLKFYDSDRELAKEMRLTELCMRDRGALFMPLLESGASHAQVNKYLNGSKPFIIISAMRGTQLSHNENLRRHVRLKHELAALGLAGITLVGNDYVEMVQSRNPKRRPGEQEYKPHIDAGYVEELSLLVPFRETALITKGEDLKQVGQSLCKLFPNLVASGDPRPKKPFKVRDTSSSTHKVHYHRQGGLDKKPPAPVTVGNAEAKEKFEKSRDQEQWGFMYFDGVNMWGLRSNGEPYMEFKGSHWGKSNLSAFWSKIKGHKFVFEGYWMVNKPGSGRIFG